MVIHQRTRPAASADDRSGIRPLALADVPALSLTWRHRLDHGDVRRLIRTFPGRSAGQAHTGRFALVGPWRNRMDVAQLLDVSAWSSAQAVVDAAAAETGRLGADLLVVIENDERRRPSLYASYGLEPVEEVVTMTVDRSGLRPLDRPGVPLDLVPVRAGSPDLPAVQRLDDLAFPWLWRNGPAEFANYLGMPDVSVFLGLSDGEPVSYFGVTRYDGWGHLDRIAVRPDLEGRGVGSATMAGALAFLTRRGARSVGLSTQAHNQRSRRLYERFGFERVPDSDYRLYGRPLRGASLADLLDLPPAPATARPTDRETRRP